MNTDLLADLELVERFSHHWGANAHSYERRLGDLRAAAKRLLAVSSDDPKNSRLLADDKRRRLRGVEKEVACLARQPLFFPDMFHGVALQSDGTFQELPWDRAIHLRANGLLGTEDRLAVTQIYERVVRSAKGPLRIVEIGSASGRGSTEIAGEFVKRSGGILYCIDTWPDRRYFAFLTNIQILDLEGTVIPVRSPSLEAAVLFEDKSLDAVFVDGSHFYHDVLADLDAFLPKIRTNGYIFGHDLYDTPSRFDRQELLSLSEKNNAIARHLNSDGNVGSVDVHPGVILAIQDRFGDEVERIANSVVWAKKV
jgi:predicted O-methyltransferase YrrM